MRIFKRPKNLRVQLDGTTKILLPGDKLVLTLEAQGTAGENTRVQASVTRRFDWDGYTLKVDKL